ncbi:MAG: amidohydrolase [Phycisphaerae bacterium]
MAANTLRSPLVCTLLATLLAIGPTANAADLVVINAKIWTANPAQPQAQAVAVTGDRIVAVDTTDQIRPHISPDTQVIDAAGRRVIPGLIDCHAHITSAGLQLTRLNLRDVPDRDAFIAEVAKAARTRQPGQWLLGGRWSVESWSNPQSPTREWIDPVTGPIPTLLSRMDGHQALANSAALKLAGIDEAGPPDPPGGQIERDPQTGQPTGILKDDAMNLVSRFIPPLSDADRDAAVLRAMQRANSMGVTAIHDMASPADIAGYERIRRAGRATLRIRAFLSTDDWPAHYDRVRNFAHDDWVTLAGFKGFMDGSLGSRTAYMHQPYADAKPDAKYPAGFLVAMSDPPEKMRRRIADADRHGFQIVVHAIGDKANTLLLDAYASAAGPGPKKDRRHRIEHAQHLTPSDIGRFASLGVIASMQPFHKADDGRYAELALGPQRCRSSYAFADLLQAGATLAFGSDWPVVSVNPFKGIAAAVTAKTLAGHTWMPHQSITVEQALQAYTAGAAYAGFAEDKLGSIQKGKLADLVILQTDPLTIPADQLENVKVWHTIVGGKTVYTAAHND